MGRPSSPARIALPGEPPTPAQTGNSACCARGAIGAWCSGGRNFPDQVTWSTVRRRSSRSIFSANNAS
jgi:hypothetical protein